MGKIRLRTWRRLVLVLFAAIFAAIVYRWISLERLQRFAPIEISGTPTPEPTATRPPVITGKLDTAKLFNGITLHSTVETTPGADAATERIQPESYVLDLKLLARVPSPNKTIDELAKVSPQLPTLLPGLTSMLSADSVSPLFAQLYDTKVRMLRENLGRLDLLLSRHNFFDCQTVLQLQHPQTHRKALLLQAEMDVDADGSDSDRLPAGTGAPANFKPATSYRWEKKTDAPNPYLAGTEQRLKRAEDEYALATTAPARKRDLRNAIAELRAEIGTLKKFSFLIGATDPFIVVPGTFTRGPDPVKVGDYALVVFGDAIYPVIVGDVGPNDKVGEASLRIAKELNALATAYNRPVSDLKVSYIIFPGTAEKPFGPPDLDKIHARCETLVKEIGGASVPLHRWENIIPSPTPSPSPSRAFAVSFVNSVGNTVSVTVADVRISRFQPRSNGVGWFDARAGAFTRGIPKASQQTETVNPGKPITQAAGYNDCLDLMHRVMAYRHEPIHSELMKIRDKYSMLHVDVLILVYHFAKLCSGAILEIGAFVGGATIAAALGVRDSGQEKKLIAVEPGGSVKHKRLGTRNILRDLERNLARERVANMVTLVKGKSFKPETMSAVRQALGSDQVGLLILDADAAKRRDVDCYRDKFAEGSWMVIDDIYGADANEKITPSRADVDALVAEGLLDPLGFYGWSTWIGRWRAVAHHQD